MKVKLCGLTRNVDIQAANKILPEYIGFVFAKNSKRKLTFEQAKQLRKQLLPQIKSVGVFVEPRFEEIKLLADAQIISCVQLHGDIDSTLIEKIQGQGLYVIQALKEEYRETIADAILLDASEGAGIFTKWKNIPVKRNKPLFLAGGLTVKNIEHAIRNTNPDVIDVSSGIETNGLKDADKMAQITQLVHKFN